MKKPICPCKDCTKHAGCVHSQCKDYVQWQEQNKEYNDIIYSARRKESMILNDQRYRLSKMTGKKLNAR